MLTGSGWRYLARASPLILAPRRSIQRALAVGWSDPRACSRVVPNANPSPSGVHFRRLSNSNTFSTSSASPPSSSSPNSTKKRGMRETSPLTGESPPLSPTESSRVTVATDEELEDVSSDGVAVETLSWKERAKNFAVEYGRVGIATHLVLSVISISVIYVVISSGVDVSGLLQTLGLSTEKTGKDSVATSAGSFVIAYAIYKIASPIRWPITFAVTPVVMRALRRRGYMLPKTKSSAHQSPRPGNSVSDREARTPK